MIVRKVVQPNQALFQVAQGKRDLLFQALVSRQGQEPGSSSLCFGDCRSKVVILRIRGSAGRLTFDVGDLSRSAGDALG